jgi:hypothetical protein
VGEALPFAYQTIEMQIVEALPELRTVAEHYWAEEGPPGEDSGPYIFVSSVFQAYVEVLLAMPDSPGRDRLLTRAFALIEEMFGAADQMVRDLAYIEFLEYMTPWWYARCRSFLGPRCAGTVWEWAKTADAMAGPDTEREIIDLHGVRGVVLTELSSEGVEPTLVPGISAPRTWQRLPGLEAARGLPDAVAFVSGFGTSHPYVICPAVDVACDGASLERLAGDLFDIEGEEPGQRWKAQVGFYRIARGERVWGMSHGGSRAYARWTGHLWVAELFEARGLAGKIRNVLAGSSPSLAADAA